MYPICLLLTSAIDVDFFSEAEMDTAEALLSWLIDNNIRLKWKSVSTLKYPHTTRLDFYQDKKTNEMDKLLLKMARKLLQAGFCLSEMRNTLSDKDEKISVDEGNSRPKSLQEVCRFQVRACMPTGKQFASAVRLLPIPLQLQSYLINTE